MPTAQEIRDRQRQRRAEVRQAQAEKKHETVLAEAGRVIDGPRKASYGDAHMNFARIWTGWEPILAADIPGPVKVALCMDWLKTARFLQSKDRDSLVDKGGYTGLAARLMLIDP